MEEQLDHSSEWQREVRSLQTILFYFERAILVFHLKWLLSAEIDLAKVACLADGRKINSEI